MERTVEDRIRQRADQKRQIKRARSKEPSRIKRAGSKELDQKSQIKRNLSFRAVSPSAIWVTSPAPRFRTALRSLRRP